MLGVSEEYSSTGMNIIENQIKILLVSFSIFEVCLASKDVVGHGLVSLRRSRKWIFKVYIGSWKDFKTDYFLNKPISLLAHEELICVISPLLRGKLSVRIRGGNFGTRTISPKVLNFIGSPQKFSIKWTGKSDFAITF